MISLSLSLAIVFLSGMCFVFSHMNETSACWCLFVCFSVALQQVIAMQTSHVEMGSGPEETAELDSMKHQMKQAVQGVPKYIWKHILHTSVRT